MFLFEFSMASRCSDPCTTAHEDMHAHMVTDAGSQAPGKQAAHLSHTGAMHAQADVRYVSEMALAAACDILAVTGAQAGR